MTYIIKNEFFHIFLIDLFSEKSAYYYLCFSLDGLRKIFEVNKFYGFNPDYTGSNYGLTGTHPVRQC